MTAIISRIAVVHTPRTKKEATDLARRAKRDGLSLPKGTQAQLAAAIMEAADRIRAVRRSRAGAKATTSVRPLKIRLAAHVAAKDAKAEELVYYVRKGLYREASDAGKYAPGSGHTTTVKIGTPRVDSDTRKVWGKQWSATASEHTYTVKRTWTADVYDRDLAVCDGLFTLDAAPVSGHGPELFAAMWVEQGRGLSLNQVRGYIARIGSTTYHAATAKAAIDGVQRKAGLKPARRKGTIDLDRLARRLGDLPVTIADSRAVGNCESGTVSWCHAMGLEPSGTATLREIVRCYQLRPMEEVLRVIHRVVRDQRNRRPITEPTVKPSSLEMEGRVIFDAEGGFHIEPSAN